MKRSAASRGLVPNAFAAALKKTEVDINTLIPPDSRPFADPLKLMKPGPFDWVKYRPIQLQNVGGRLFVQDGMTRIENARRAGITKLPAYIFTD